MKKDHELFRTLMLGYVDDPSATVQLHFFQNADENEKQIEYHIELLADAGFVVKSSEHIDPPGRGGSIRHGRRIVRSFALRVTNSGHDFLDAIRDDGIWNKTKQAVAETGGSATLEIIKSLATGFLKKKIEQHTDIAL